MKFTLIKWRYGPRNQNLGREKIVYYILAVSKLKHQEFSEILVTLTASTTTSDRWKSILIFTQDYIIIEIKYEIAVRTFIFRIDY